MAQRSRRTIPDRMVPFLDAKTGLITEQWYQYLYWHDEEHGGRRSDRLLRTATGAPIAPAPSAIAGAAGTLTVNVDGTNYQVVFE